MGRPPDLTPEEAEEVRLLYYDRSAKWTTGALARLYRVQPSTIRAAIDRRGAYARKPSKPGEKR